MARIMIKCPETGRPVYTGMSMDKTSFETSKLQDNSIICPACGKEHTWSKKDAVLEE